MADSNHPVAEAVPSGSAAPAAEQRRFRNALGRFATGVTVVTAVTPEGDDVGVTANSFNSVSLDPPLVLWSIARNSTSIGVFEQTGHFAVHVLGADQRPLSERFARKGGDKFDGLPVGRGHGGVPLIEGAAAVFQCRTAQRHAGGDHVIIVGEVLEFDERDHAPLVYHAGAYGLVLGAGDGVRAPRAGSDDADAPIGDLLRDALHRIDAEGEARAVADLGDTERLVLRRALSRIVAATIAETTP